MAEGKRSRESPHVHAHSSEFDGGRTAPLDHFTNDVIEKVFGTRQATEASALVSKRLEITDLDAHIERTLEDALQEECATGGEIIQEGEDGRIGGTEVVFDIVTNVGTLIVEPDRLGLSSLSNFSTMRSNCCVYKGKWVYELLLGSKGVMQLGWCTLNCKFSQEEGVGDTINSYAYDGSRLIRWNVKKQKYGEKWLTGDVITCAIDCDNGIITFYRNGQSMGEAFNNVRTGPGLAYFPAVSLSLSENLRANFGGTPLRYPLEGYRPLQDPDLNDLARANVLFNYMENLIPVIMEDKYDICSNVIGVKDDEPLPPLSANRSHECTGLLIAAHIMEHLGPLLRSAYIVEDYLLKLLCSIVDYKDINSEQVYICKLLDLLWTLLQDFEVKSCMEHLVICLLSAYRFSPVTNDFCYMKKYLIVTLAILRHKQTRQYLLRNVLFDKVKFPIFMHIKPPCDNGLAEMIPTAWWENQSKDDDEMIEEKNSPEDLETKKKYYQSCEELRIKIEEIENLQVEILKVLLIHNDVNEKNETTRVIFLEKFRSFLRELSGVGRVQQAHSCPLSVSLCFFHRLIQAVRYYWDHFRQEDPNRFVSSKDAFMPVQEFWSDSRDYFDYQRCGGLMSHLNRILGGEVNKAQGLVVYGEGKEIKVKSVEQVPGHEYPNTELPSGNSLIDLLDGLVILYHSAAHKQLGKMCATREAMKDFILALQDTEEKYNRCPDEMPEVKEDLLRAKTVFIEKITEQARQMAFVIAVIYSKSKQDDVSWILNVTLKTVEKAEKFRKLFQFMPEFYIETCANAYNALKNYIHPTTPFENIEGYEELLRRYATFLTVHFANQKIVSNDLRDTLVGALACFTCYPNTLHILETLPMENRETMIRALIAPYENRSWAHTNWILVRIWKGCGFGFRYKTLPNLVPSKVQPTEFSFVSLQKPCPSQILQSLLAKILLDDEPTSTRFLDTLMNQLNWSFSEFIGIMQEIQQLVSRTEHLYIESRQLKICAACFEISVCLLRVLEMVVTIAPDLFTDYCRSSAELFLKRIMQLISQVLSRITSKNGAFESLAPLSVPGLDSVTFYPIITVVVGILVQLIGRSGGTSQERSTRALLIDSGFQIKTLEFVFKEGDSSQKFSKPFNFRSFDEISNDEIQDVESLIMFLKKQESSMSKQSQDYKEEDVCTICYANVRSCIFEPCSHQSCRTCITHQLMNKKECFFCKSVINAITDMKKRPILREYFHSSKKT